ncbi:MAG: hypothetical protein JKY52_00360 [Flavobacteriales bacterium]|nr:hypothetical protein [Flavobacteriales bacterium]
MVEEDKGQIITAFNLESRIANKAARFTNNIVDTAGFYFTFFLLGMAFDRWLGFIPGDRSFWVGGISFFYTSCITPYSNIFLVKHLENTSLLQKW